MAQIRCDNCGEVFEDQEFCPNCGQWVGPIPEGGDFEEFSLSDTPDEETFEEPTTLPPEARTVTCPSCGAPNPATNRHCEECGARIAQGPLPVAPQPMIRTTAGARALMAIVGTIAVVAVIALLYNSIFGGGEVAATTTSSSTTSTTIGMPERIVPIAWNCSSEIAGGWECANMFDGDDTTYWNDAGAEGRNATIEVTFAGPVSLKQIIFQNVTDEEKFKRNFRVKGIEITFDDLPDAPLIDALQDTTRAQPIPVASLRTRQLTIRVTSTYPAESVNGLPPFTELAIAEIEFWGNPSQ